MTRLTLLLLVFCCAQTSPAQLIPPPPAPAVDEPVPAETPDPGLPRHLIPPPPVENDASPHRDEMPVPPPATPSQRANSPTGPLTMPPEPTQDPRSQTYPPVPTYGSHADPIPYQAAPHPGPQWRQEPFHSPGPVAAPHGAYGMPGGSGFGYNHDLAAPLSWGAPPGVLAPAPVGGIHQRYPYYSYRRPWYTPGPASHNVTIIW